MKAVNNDAQRILSEPSNLSEAKLHKLRENLQKCNDHYMKLDKKLRDKVSRAHELGLVLLLFNGQVQE